MAVSEQGLSRRQGLQQSVGGQCVEISVPGVPAAQEQEHMQVRSRAALECEGDGGVIADEHGDDDNFRLSNRRGALASAYVALSHRVAPSRNHTQPLSSDHTCLPPAPTTALCAYGCCAARDCVPAGSTRGAPSQARIACAARCSASCSRAMLRCSAVSLWSPWPRAAALGRDGRTTMAPRSLRSANTAASRAIFAADDGRLGGARAGGVGARAWLMLRRHRRAKGGLERRVRPRARLAVGRQTATSANEFGARGRRGARGAAGDRPAFEGRAARRAGRHAPRVRRKARLERPRQPRGSRTPDSAGLFAANDAHRWTLFRMEVRVERARREVLGVSVIPARAGEASSLGPTATSCAIVFDANAQLPRPCSQSAH